MKNEIRYGIVDGAEFSLRGPRGIDGDEYETLREAFIEACSLIEGGTYDEIDIVRCKYYGDDGNGYWGEDRNYSSISVDARNADWAGEEDEEA